MSSTASEFETLEARQLVRQIEQIQESPELTQALHADAKRFFIRRVIPCALVAELAGTAFGFAIGSPSWAIAASSVAVFMAVAAFWPRK